MIQPCTVPGLSSLSPKSLKNVVLGFGLVLLVFLVGSTFPSQRLDKLNILDSPLSPSMSNVTTEARFKRPDGVNITGVVFYGRARLVDILDCYLQKNLAVNGGLLDKVLFMMNTDDKEDLAWLGDLADRVPQYEIVPVKRPNNSHGWGGFNLIWASLTDPDTIYLKIDDDIVWIDDDAVPRMIETLIKHPEAHDIAGNIINSPITSFMHYHQGAVRPFLPDLKAPEQLSPPTDWRTSHLPFYDGPLSEKYDWDPQNAKPNAHFSVGDKGGPPYENHRWLPLPDTSENILRTPISGASYDAFGMGWKSWAMGAQQHYSLLRNIEEKRLERYWFGDHQEGIWDMQYTRYNLNFLAIWGSSVAKALPGSDDEQDMTVTIPLRLKKPCLINTRALVAHFSFGIQTEISHTDLLDRYRLYANEHVCAADNQKARLPFHGGGQG
ncbi:hypothetical protein PFICI_03679 [Pestalotiopsis fici W106-1]|uniref:Uncharacterized protein n=1 Tax=Pestalotiopsis fici (strain W106-1 / CGMCC3.15140) TaxID=1229662 RepID=W3XI23_PESFW|nr:uncharacterized protein PFICI_03679 [Pestalotiopsis fici W106-1]ETS85654.1 hypothetical protein PFICI_03679 [Pestalotiopsis fici W106-1]